MSMIGSLRPAKTSGFATRADALASLRLEKGYRDYVHDIDNTDNAFETGLGSSST